MAALESAGGEQAAAERGAARRKQGSARPIMLGIERAAARTAETGAADPSMAGLLASMRRAMAGEVDRWDRSSDGEGVFFRTCARGVGLVAERMEERLAGARGGPGVSKAARDILSVAPSMRALAEMVEADRPSRSAADAALVGLGEMCSRTLKADLDYGAKVSVRLSREEMGRVYEAAMDEMGVTEELPSIEALMRDAGMPERPDGETLARAVGAPAGKVGSASEDSDR